MQGVAIPYIRAVERAGGLPVLLPFEVGRETASAFLQTIDGLLLTGGGDIAPAFTGREGPLREVLPQRDATEFLLVHRALTHGLPLLAICRGLQVLNVALGGTLYLHLPQELPGLPHDAPREQRHQPVHPVRIAPQSHLAQLVQTQELGVNSLHHQGIRDLAPGLQAVAWAPDGLVEAVELPDHPFALGLQWHPELLVEHDPRMLRLFQALVEHARTFQVARKLQEAG